MNIERRRSAKDFHKTFPTSTAQHYQDYCKLWQEIQNTVNLARNGKANLIPALFTFLEEKVSELSTEVPHRQELLQIIISKCYEYKRYYPEFSCNKAFKYLNKIEGTFTEAEQTIIAEQATFLSKTICRNKIPTAKTIIENNRLKFVTNHPWRLSKAVHILSSILSQNLDTHRFDIVILPSTHVYLERKTPCTCDRRSSP